MAIVYAENMVQVITRVVNYNDAGIDTGVKIGEIPLGAAVVGAFIVVQTAFNAGTTNVFNAGFSAAGTEYINTTEAAVTVTGRKEMLRAFSLNPLAALRDVYVRFTQTGTAATAGRLHFIILWAYA